MLERIYIKNYLTFKEAELEFDNGLIVFSGPSGAGKSILMRAILSIFGYFDAKASLSEAVLNYEIDLEKYGLENDEEIIFKQIKKNKNRYFINHQIVSKKIVKKISEEFVDYLSLGEIKEFKNENIIGVLDKIVKEKDYYVKLENYKKKYKTYKEKEKQLNEIKNKEKTAKERAEFLRYELEKINSINPKEREFEELMQIKKDLSKLEKIKEKAKEVEEIFEFENKVFEFLEMVDYENEFFSTAMNELRIALDKVYEKEEFLQNIDIEEVLDRLSKLQELIRRFGSIDEAINYAKEKQKELNTLENLSFEKEYLEKEIKNIENELKKEAEYFHKKREEVLKIFEEKINNFLKKLYMPQIKLSLKETFLYELGKSKVEIILNNIDINSISTGELNRLRVALLAAKLEYTNEKKTLFLDEIDANLSGEESMSVAEVLKLLSQKYQIFAISHQPQLTSVANKHFLITKKDNHSFVKELNKNERIEEIARIISGKEKSQKALDYAKELLKVDNG